MLNCFYWYGFIWSGVFFLYCLNFSEFSMRLDPFLIAFFVTTILTSFILGFVFRAKFRFEYDSGKKLRTGKYTLIFFILGALAEFVYAREIPFFAVAFQGTSSYKDFSGIPVFNVLLTGTSTYYAVKCYYIALCRKEERIKYLLHFAAIQVIYLFCFLRSQILFNVFCAGTMTLAYLKNLYGIKPRHILLSILVALLILYVFGGLGNLRSGVHKWNDSTFIGYLGLFHNWPERLPEQYKWAYCYIITPLSNLNYNILRTKPSYNLMDYICQLVPQTIAKRVFLENPVSQELLVREYFTATSGYTQIYSSMGIAGMFVYQLYLNAITLIGIRLSDRRRNVNRKTVFFSIACLIYVFLFFTNTVYFVGTSFVLWIPFIGMMMKERRLKVVR